MTVLVINRAGRKIWRQTSYKLEASFQRVSKSEEEASFAYRASVSEVQLSLVNFFRGNWADAFLHAQASCPAELGSSLEGSGQGILFRQMAYAGNRNGALAILDEKRALLPRSGQPSSLAAHGESMRLHNEFVGSPEQISRTTLWRMTMGTRTSEQLPLWIAASELPKSPGHPFYMRLSAVLDAQDFDRFVEDLCSGFYAPVMGRPSLAPGRYFRLLLIGYFEGLDAERGIAWRAADSLAVRGFLRLALDEAAPDHSTISWTRRLINLETHRAVFTCQPQETADRE